MVEGEGGNRSVRVEIYGQPYSIRTEGQSEHIFALAEMVDRRMAEIARQTLTVDSLKVAILAALHIAEELHNTRQQLEEIDRDIAERSSRVTAELEQFLKRHILEPIEQDDQNRER
ncbi:MAG: cell division protein ZapA [Blastocatellia bacterium]|nr:cell division protein ZapA [Blastocatellia bacterium]